MAAVAGLHDPQTARNQLLARCLEVRLDNEPLAADQLPDEIVAAVAAALDAADPQANVQLALTCPACEHSWQANFDIASFFWQELTDHARRLLREVHLLAMAYGWYEADILALSPARRRTYVEMIAG